MPEVMNWLPLPLAIVTANGETVAVNQAFHSAWPKTAPKAGSKTGSRPSLLDLIDNDDRQRVLAVVHRVAMGKPSPEELLVKVNGKLRHVQVAASPLPPGMAPAAAVLLLPLDIDPRADAADDLTFSESRWNHA